jgi:YfiH family protein
VVEAGGGDEELEADAAFARRPGAVCAVLTADCLPVLLCDDAGTVVAAAHAGWRGLCAGVIERTLRAMDRPPAGLLAYLGPAIGPAAYEVGAEVRQAFLAADPKSETAFAPGASGKFYADLYALARQRLARSGVVRIYGGSYCTYTERERFFSYRRDGATGRMASLIWMES